MSIGTRTFVNRFRRFSLFAAGGSALLAFALASLADLWSVRREGADDFSRLVKAIATADTFVAEKDSAGRVTRSLPEFAAIPGLKLVCLYNARNEPVGEWHGDESSGECPHFAIGHELGTGWSDIFIGIPIFHDRVYFGMVRALGSLVTLNELVAREAIIASALLLCVFLTILIMKRLTARDIRLQITAVHAQLECFKDPHKTDCTILPRNFTIEMAGVMNSIGQLHDHYINTMVSKLTMERSQRWHRQVFSYLVATLRYQVGDDSNLLRDLNDYALVMQTENEHALPAEQLFDCAALLDKALADARRIQPPQRRVHLSVSLQSGMPRLYTGHPEMIESLLRHLLLIAFRRTKTGLILLRLAPGAAQEESGRVMLCISLEDSGPPLQPWQLRQWFSQSEEQETPFVSDGHALSWVLASKLFHHLKGHAKAESVPDGGLKLTGQIPLSIAWRPAFEQIEAPVEVTHLAPPLLLAVEPETVDSQELIDACRQAGYRVFIVQDQGQAVEWSLCLPISATLLNMSASGSWVDTAQRMRRAMHQHLMPKSAIWAVTTQLLPGESDGIDHVLLKPLRPSILKSMCTLVKAIDVSFYHIFDKALRDDLPISVISRMPYMHQQLVQEITRLKDIANMLARDLPCPEAAQQAHAVKSIALSLGYFRLAALMTEVEYAVVTQSFAHVPQNWSIIADCLAQACLLYSPAVQNPAERLAVSS